MSPHTSSYKLVEEVESCISADEEIPSSIQQQNSSKWGRVAAVCTLLGILGAVAVFTVRFGKQQETLVESGGDYLDLYTGGSNKVGLPEGADNDADMSSTLSTPKLCDTAVVQHICGEIKGMPTDELGVMDIAEAIGLDKVPTLTFLGSLGLTGMHSHVTVKCQKLCEGVLAAIPPYRRPPGHDVGGRVVNNKVIWDIDLSPAALTALAIPEKPSDPKGDKPDPDPNDVPLERKLASGSASSVIAADANDLLANLFRIYPRPPFEIKPAQDEKQATAGPCSTVTAAPNPCATAPRRLKQEDVEAIYGNGKDYVGHQTTTRTGKTCLRWSSMGGRWSQRHGSESNYCRNSDGSETIWCFTSTSYTWGYCDPIGAPKMFAEFVEKARIVGKAWLTKSLREFSGAKLPDAYEKWMGPSQTVAKKGLTKKGCACKQQWSYSGTKITDYCGNPDSDAGGEWCLVRDDQKSCQGTNWGYCFPASERVSKPCGPACQGVHKKLLATAALLDQVTFKYDAADDGAYGYIYSWGTTVSERIPVQQIGSIQSSYKANGKVLFKTSSDSDEIKGRKVIYLCPTWYNLCHGDWTSCKSNAYNFGTTVGTIVHEAMHHVPVGLKDYLYYRTKTSQWVASNKNDNLATKVVKHAADPMEYFVADNNGYKNTGR